MGEDAAARRPPGVPAFLSSVSSWFKPYRRLCALVSAGLIMEAAFVSGMPLLFQALIDRAIVPRRPDLLFELIGVLLTSALIVSGASVGRDFLYARLITTVASDLRIKLFDRLARLSPDYFRRTAVADISSRFSNDLTSVEHALSTLVAWLILPALDILLGTVLLFMIDWRLGLIAQLLWPLSLLGPQWIGPRASLAAMELKNDQARLLALVEEVSSGQAVVRAFGLRDHVSSTFRRAVDDVARRGVRVHFLSSMMERSSGIGIRLMQVLVLGAGAWLAFHDSLSIGALVAFQTLFTSVAFSLGYVSQYMPALVQAAVGLDRIEHLLADDSGIADTAGAVTLPADWKELTLDHVSFAPEGRAIIDDVSLRVASGESVALVGRSGSGKSTLLNLIMRSYDPTSGSVSLDGHDYRMATHDSLARQQAAVFQESFLFNTSLRENIRLGRPEASGAEVGDAARMAGLYDVIASLPDGLDALVGERGGGLSGGQRQRVAIARALLRNPRLLLLDEATSALDVGLETELNRTLADVRRGRTVISVSHRLSAIADYDRIVVLENGRVAEQGSHDELLALGGTYRALWQKQSGFRVSSTGDQAGVDAARLKAIPLLRSLSLETLDRLARRFATERVPAERTVVQQGDAGDRFYIIVRGMVNVFVEDGDDEREVATLEVGDHFGEIALLEDTPRTATVRTVVPSVFITLSREDFLGLLNGSPELRGLLSQRVASRRGSLAAGATRDIREI